MKSFFATLLLVFAVAAQADVCHNALSANYSNAMTELAQGYIALEQMKTEGTAPASAYSSWHRALEDKRRQLVQYIGNEQKFDKLFSNILNRITRSSGRDQSRQRVQRQKRANSEVSDFGSWAESRVLYGANKKVESFRFSGDGSLLAVKVGKTNEVEILNGSSFKPIYKFQLHPKDEGTFHFEFSPDNQHFLVSHGHEVRLYDLSTGLHAVLMYADMHSYTGMFSPDGQRILMTSEQQLKLVRMSDLKDLKTMYFFTGNNLFRSAVFSDDSQNILLTTGESLEVWDIEGKELAHMATNDEVTYQWARFSPDKSSVISSYYTSVGGVIQTWDWQKNIKPPFFKRFFHKRAVPVEIFDYVQKIFEAPYAPTGELFFNTKAGLVSYDPSSGAKTVHDFKAEIAFSAFSPDFAQMLMITKTSKLYVWDMKFRGQTDEFEIEEAKAAQFSADGKKILVLQKNGRLVVLTRQTQAVVE